VNQLVQTVALAIAVLLGAAICIFLIGFLGEGARLLLGVFRRGPLSVHDATMLLGSALLARRIAWWMLTAVVLGGLLGWIPFPAPVVTIVVAVVCGGEVAWWLARRRVSRDRVG
jgi:hypothetical protein